MKKQADLIHDSKWDILIILDAVPYGLMWGMFNVWKIDHKIKNMRIERVSSPASFTIGWLLETFQDKPMKDVVFVSGSPAVSSKSAYSEPVYILSKRLKYEGYSFDAREHFKKIIDVWDFGYDKEMGLIHPKTMTDEIIKAVKKYPDCRFISKYWQMHDPYIYYLEQGEKNLQKGEDIFYRDRAVFKYANVKGIIGRFLSDETIWTIRKKLNMIPDGGLGKLWIEKGKEGIIEGYMNDFRMTLDFIVQIVKEFPEKKIVISSDHGEKLGQGGRYGHQATDRSEIISTVAWWEIPPR